MRGDPPTGYPGQTRKYCRKIAELVNQAGLSRLPRTSEDTLSNIHRAGYGSMVKLAKADPDQLYQDFYRYGSTIGMNLIIGNEINNSYGTARIMPLILV